MNDSNQASINVVTHELNGCLIVPIQDELTIEDANKIQEAVLSRLHKQLSCGVIIDFSGVDIIDSALWDTFVKAVHMIKVMGSQAAITGLSPGIVAAIIDLNLDIGELNTRRSVEDAMDFLLSNH